MGLEELQAALEDPLDFLGQLNGDGLLGDYEVLLGRLGRALRGAWYRYVHVDKRILSYVHKIE